MVTFFTVPRTASQKSIWIPYSRSEPGSSWGPPLRLSPAKELAEEIPEVCAARAAEIESAKIEVSARVLLRRDGASAFGIEAKLIVHLPFFGIRKDVVGFLNLLEFFFRGFVAGVQVRMILAGQLPIGLANLFLAGFAANAQKFVIILFGCGRHNSDSLAACEAAIRLKLRPTGVEFRQFGLLAR